MTEGLTPAFLEGERFRGFGFSFLFSFSTFYFSVLCRAMKAAMMPGMVQRQTQVKKTM